MLPPPEGGGNLIIPPPLGAGRVGARHACPHPRPLPAGEGVNYPKIHPLSLWSGFSIPSPSGVDSQSPLPLEWILNPLSRWERVRVRAAFMQYFHASARSVSIRTLAPARAVRISDAVSGKSLAK